MQAMRVLMVPKKDQNCLAALQQGVHRALLIARASAMPMRSESHGRQVDKLVQTAVQFRRRL